MYVDLYDNFNDISTIPESLKKSLISELDYSPLSLVVKKIEALIIATSCNKMIWCITIKGTTSTTNNTFERTVVKSETGNDLQKMRLLSFLSSAKVDRL